MNTYLLHQILTQFRTPLLAYFRKLSEQDVDALLAEESETLLTVLHARYGYTSAQAKAAWNDFVLRYVDGHAPTHPSGFALTGQCLQDARSGLTARRRCKLSYHGPSSVKRFRALQ